MKKIFTTVLAAFIAMIALNSCSDVPAPFDIFNGDQDTTTVVQPEGEGTAASPYNIAAINKIAGELETGATSTETYYFKGIVSSVKEISASYGNASFYLSDDGTSTDKFYVYHAYGLGNKKITDEDLFQAGDTIVVCGKICNYSGTLETSGNNAYIYSINGKTVAGADEDDYKGNPSGAGTLASPYNIAAIIAQAKTLETGATSSENYYFEGIVDSVKEVSTKYGNATFYLSDDGTKTGLFYVYHAYGLENQKITDSKLIKKGDKVIVYGKICNYQGTIETSGNNAYIYSINGKTKADVQETPKFEKVTTISAGEYIFYAPTAKMAMKSFTKNYGYLLQQSITPSNNIIETSNDSIVFTIASAGEGIYTIKDCAGKYVYLSGTYNSFNLSATAPTEGHTWKFEPQSDGTFKILNVLKSKWIQYSSSYTSWGSYDSAKGEMPELYKKK